MKNKKTKRPILGSLQAASEHFQTKKLLIKKKKHFFAFLDPTTLFKQQGELACLHICQELGYQAFNNFQSGCI